MRMHKRHNGNRQASLNWCAAIASGMIAGCVATIAQIVLWWLFLDGALPEILYRDARLAAAIVLGPEALPPPATFDVKIMLVATLLHFALSITYSVILANILLYWNVKRSLLAGIFYGLALYGINMYGFTLAFPWFSLTRDWITLAAHVVFGCVAAGGYTVLDNRVISAIWRQ